MKATVSREIRLASRPKGIPTAANFTLAQVELKKLPDQQVLVRNLFMSVDPQPSHAVITAVSLLMRFG